MLALICKRKKTNVKKQQKKKRLKICLQNASQM